ncbi:MAG: AMP-binding protein [Actinopolymorphaceae bacterium]
MGDHLGTLLESLTDLVADVDPGRVAVVHGTRERSWAALDERAARLAGWLAGAGVRAGERVGIGLYNSIESVETLYAVFKLRAVPVNVNYRYHEDELAHVLSYADIAAVVVDASLRERLRQVAARLPALRACVLVGESPREEPDRSSGTRDEPVADTSIGYAEALTGPALPRQERSGTDQILIMTGGTTGTPKGVVWEHAGVRGVVTSVYRRNRLPIPANAAETLATARQAITTGTAPVMLPVSPLMHGTGFFFTLGNLLLGGRIVCLAGRSLDPAEVWTAAQAQRVEELAIVGDAFARPLLAELDRAARDDHPYDLSSLRRVVSSGVAWSPDVKRRLLAAGRMTLQDSIASTEGGPYGISLVGPGLDDPGTGSDGPGADHAGDVAATRFALPPNARVIAPDGTDVVPGSGQVGELASSGPLPLGYLDDPVRTAAVFRVIDGVRYAVPGDAATVEVDGTLTLLGRGSGVVNTGGEKVYVEEVEEALLTHPDVDQAVVVGIPDERWGARVTALVRLVADARPSADALVAQVGARLAGYKRPRQVFFVPEIARTMSGKADRHWAAVTARRLAGADAGGDAGGDAGKCEGPDDA